MDYVGAPARRGQAWLWDEFVQLAQELADPQLSPKAVAEATRAPPPRRRLWPRRLCARTAIPMTQRAAFVTSGCHDSPGRDKIIEWAAANEDVLSSAAAKAAAQGRGTKPYDQPKTGEHGGRPERRLGARPSGPRSGS